MDSVHHIGGDIHRAVKAEGHVGAENIVVNRLGQTNDMQPLFAEKVGGLVGAVAAQRHETVELHVFVILLHSRDLVDVVLLDDAHIAVGLAAGTENRAAQREQSREIVRLHHLIGAVDQTLVAVVDADKLHIHQIEGRVSHAADGRVESGAVAAACQNSHSAFCHSKVPPG